MYKLFIFLLVMTMGSSLWAQETVYPAPAQKRTIIITNATLHIGNGTLIQKGSLVIEKGKITQVIDQAIGAIPTASGAELIDATGKHVYPGLISANSMLGLQEIGSGVRATNDFAELGNMNPNVRSIVAYNTDSKIINTLRTNGILLVNVVPQSGLLSGTSSVVQLDAWNWEDAAYAMDAGIHFNMPTLLNRGGRFAAFARQSGMDPIKAGLERIEEVKQFFRSAKAYLDAPEQTAKNLKFEAVSGLFTGEQRLFIHCNLVKEMLVALDFVREFKFKIVIVGGSESWQIASILKQENIPVILDQSHSLPTLPDDDIDQPYKTPAMLHAAGVVVAINDNDSQNRGRNLSFNAGTAAAYGMDKEAAIQAITLNPAKILGIDERTGSLEQGKDANLVISTGDILDMRSSVLTHAFIQGRSISLVNKQTQLSDRYHYKYGIK